MIGIGRMCIKIAGRDAGKIGVIIDTLDDKTVLLDGQTRRRKCSINHIELMEKSIEIEKNASNPNVVSALKAVGVECEEKKEVKGAEKSIRPTKVKVVKKAPASEGGEAKTVKKAAEKKAPKKEASSEPAKTEKKTTTKKAKKAE
jgi:large subunit ribosomal protein L14e